MIYPIFAIAFIPLALIAARLSLAHITYKKAKPMALLVAGIIFLLLGLLGCYRWLPENLMSGEAKVVTRGLVVDATQSQDPVQYWGLIILLFGGAVVCAGLGLASIRLYLRRRSHPDPWTKSGHTWHYQGPSLKACASINPIAPALIIHDLQARSAAPTVRQMHAFLWQTHQHFPTHEIWLHLTPATGPLIKTLASTGRIRLRPTRQPSPAFIQNVGRP